MQLYVWDLVLSQVFKLSCDRHADAPSSCQPVIYYNASHLETLGLSWDHDGGQTPVQPLPLVENNDRLNRTDAGTFTGTNTSNMVMRPLLYFYGDPSCHITLNNVTIKRVNLTRPDDLDHWTQARFYLLLTQTVSWWRVVERRVQPPPQQVAPVTRPYHHS